MRAPAAGHPLDPPLDTWYIDGGRYGSPRNQKDPTSWSCWKGTEKIYLIFGCEIQCRVPVHEGQLPQRKCWLSRDKIIQLKKPTKFPCSRTWMSESLLAKIPQGDLRPESTPENHSSVLISWDFLCLWDYDTTWHEDSFSLWQEVRKFFVLDWTLPK